MKSKLFAFIFLTLLVLVIRIIPHPPNFSPLIAISFYTPILLGINFLPFLIFSYALTDVVIGFHETLIFVWGSFAIIGLISKIFNSSMNSRILGILASSLLFYLLSNFGVWLTGSHAVKDIGFINTYLIAMPFFKNTLISTIIYSIILEAILKKFKKQKFIF